ncbi:transglutaminase family protein [Limnobacter sp.]|uniref:transglutaminase family protein n=1 Tax=Limnobacter sp. TaxID=2003368 RepID=UPI002584FA0B|nr:transglutaminase family protein [Limnobacter sp.]
MKLHIEHHTEYTYSWPVIYSIQHIRLTPFKLPNQQVLKWEISTPAKASHTLDHFGNKVTHFTVNQSHQRLEVTSRGVVELTPLQGGYLHNQADPVNPLVFSGATPLTVYTPDMAQFSSFVADKHIPFEARMLALANAVADRVQYKTGSTTVAHTAADAFENGEGVCQDHAHLMLACLRAHGFCARYVSGYRFSEHAPEHASHAWIDVYNPDKQAWLSVDATHRCLADEFHCRLAVARDFTGASPVRGVRSGGGEERMKVGVAIELAA